MGFRLNPENAALPLLREIYKKATNPSFPQNERDNLIKSFSSLYKPFIALGTNTATLSTYQKLYLETTDRINDLRTLNSISQKSTRKLIS